MSVPISQQIKVAGYVLAQKLKGNKRYPLVLMLEPLFRCNLECSGCGKIQYPTEILKRHLSVEECLKAVDECEAPVVSIPGGEPLLHPQIDEIVNGIIARGKFVYLCTNALLLEKKLSLFTPNKYLTFNVHIDGLEEDHDTAVCRKGVYKLAVDAIKKALSQGFRVTTNTTLFEGIDSDRIRQFFDVMMELNVEGITISPGYSYQKAPDPEHFLQRKQSRELFKRILSNRKKRWHFNQSPLFLEFLMGKQDYICTPWGNPTYNLLGWQQPCYLLQEGYTKTFKELMRLTSWEQYGTGKHKACADCMVHCGYEPTSVDHTFSSFKGFLMTVRAYFSLYKTVS